MILNHQFQLEEMDMVTTIKTKDYISDVRHSKSPPDNMRDGDFWHRSFDALYIYVDHDKEWVCVSENVDETEHPKRISILNQSLILNKIPVVDMKATGVNIRKLRIDKGITVKQIQAVFGFTTPQAIYKWEHGVALPTVDNLVVLSRIFDVAVDDILIID